MIVVMVMLVLFEHRQGGKLVDNKISVHITYGNRLGTGCVYLGYFYAVDQYIEVRVELSVGFVSSDDLEQVAVVYVRKGSHKPTLVKYLDFRGSGACVLQHYPGNAAATVRDVDVSLKGPVDVHHARLEIVYPQYESFSVRNDCQVGVS